MASTIPRIRLPSWSLLKEELRDEEGWIFRGQRDSTWELATSLQRAMPEGDYAPATESTLLFQFQAHAHNYIAHGQLPRARAEWLARMQHHGVPTRLLDFTSSPYVAAYFAIEDATAAHDDASERACAIWAIGVTWSLVQAGGRLGNPSRDFASAFATVRNWYEKEDNWPEFDGVVPLITQRRNEREAVQQELFVAPGSLLRPFAHNLESMQEGLDANVRCYELPYSWRPEVLTDLRKMNITRASLFPGLDGFAQSLRYGLITEPTHDKKLRSAARRQS